MKTIEDLHGTFEVNQKYVIELSENDAWFSELGRTFEGVVHCIEKEGCFESYPLFKVSGIHECFFLVDTKVKLIEELM